MTQIAGKAYLSAEEIAPMGVSEDGGVGLAMLILICSPLVFVILGELLMLLTNFGSDDGVGR